MTYESLMSEWTAEVKEKAEYIAQLEAENEELKKKLAQYELFREVVGDPAHEFASLRRELHRVERENAKLRELVYDMLVDEERGHNDDLTFDEHVRLAKDLGIEVES